MTTKALISKKVASKISLSLKESLLITESFLLIIKNNSKSKILKISGFGSFKSHTTPERIGRNPKTKDSYIIPQRCKLNFKPSNIVKETLN
tara:strand:+ start:114 stop:386 length:273 start_codon:yes stop_codon:yes gene_type:complete